MIKQFIASTFATMFLALTVTPELVTAIVAAVFVGLVNLYVVRTARLLALKEITEAIKPVEKKIDTLVPVVAKIDGHVNSEKTKAEGEITAHKLEISLQRDMIDEMKKAAALLAQAKATLDVSSAVPQAAVAGASVPASKTVSTLKKKKQKLK